MTTSENILIVEDDPLMSRMYKRVFKFSGFSIEVADNGEEGLKKARSAKPALILLDIMMPKMSGLEVLEELKKDSTTRDIPVVMLTNLAGSGDTKKALAMGAEKYVIKSDQSPEGMVELVREMLKTKNKGEEGDVSSTDDGKKFRDMYIKLAKEHLVKLSEAFEEKTEQLGGKEMEGLVRAAHTLKGQSAGLEYRKMEAMAELIENLLRDVSEGKKEFGFGIRDELKGALKKMSESVASIEKTKEELDLTSEIKRMEKVVKENV